jgi:excisionase family DNA binding protein
VISAAVLDELAAGFAARLAPLVAAELSPATTTAPPESWRLVNLEEAAARLGRSTRWVRERVTRGELPHVRLDGGALAFEVADLQAFATARRVDGSTARVLA